MNSVETQGEFWGTAAEVWTRLFEPFTKPIWIAMADIVVEERVFSPRQIK